MTPFWWLEEHAPTPGLFQRLATLHCHDLGNVFCVLLNLRFPRKQELRAPVRSGLAPAWQRCLCSVDGFGGIFTAALAHLSNNLLCGRVEDLQVRVQCDLLHMVPENGSLLG